MKTVTTIEAFDGAEGPIALTLGYFDGVHLGHQVATSLGCIGLALQSLGRYEEALKYKQQALDINRKVYGQEHPEVAISLCSMGAVLAKMQDLKGAKECFQQAVAIGEKVLPEDHPYLELYRKGLAAVERRSRPQAPGASNKKKDSSVM